jgi:putative CocE/NonD family hydrolase
VASDLLAFFDRVFERDRARAGEPHEPHDAPARVRYFVLGANAWRTAESWPPPRVVVERWNAWSPSGNANSRWGDGLLAPATGPGPDTVPTPVAASAPASVLVVEPHVPYPGSPLDFQDESPSEGRRDVLCFTSAPLLNAMSIAGSPVVRVVTQADRPSHDVVVTMTMVEPSGCSRALTGYATRVCSSDEQGTDRCTVELRLRPVAVEIAAGHRLRLDVSGARFPCYDRNPHVADGSPDTTAGEHVVATIEVWRAEIELPVLPVLHVGGDAVTRAGPVAAADGRTGEP